MRNQSDVITQASDEIVKKLADEYEVTLGRMYEILSTDNPLPKTKRLIRAIAHCDTSKNKARVRLIKAELDALFNDLLGETHQTVSVTDLHKESSEAVQAILNGEPTAVIKQETREMIAVGHQILAQMDDDELTIGDVRTIYDKQFSKESPAG